MFTFLLGYDSGGEPGPMGPDAPAREPQMAVQGPWWRWRLARATASISARPATRGRLSAAPGEGRRCGDHSAFAASRTADRFSGPHIVITAVVGKTSRGGACAWSAF